MSSFQSSPASKPRRIGSDGLTASQRWYCKLKSDPARYLAWVEKQEEYARKHKRHLRAKHRKTDRKRHKKMMRDPELHETRLAQRRERHRIRMETDPDYREKCRLRAQASNAKIRAAAKADPALAARLNAEAAERQRARHDFLASTPEGKKALRDLHFRQWERVKSDPAKHEKHKEICREYQRKYRQTDEYKAKKEKERKVREQKRRKAITMKAYRQRPEVKARQLQHMKAYIASHPEYNKKRYLNVVAKCESDPEYYARFRARSREYSRKCNGKTRKGVYVPALSRRIPDYCVRGKVVDPTSTFLRNNLSDDHLRSCDAYARDQAIAQREWLCDNNKV